MGINEPSFYKNINQTYFYFLQHGENPYLIVVNVGEEAYSGDISISVGSDQGSVVLYYCPPELERQPNLEEEKLLSWGNYNSVLEKCLLSCCFEIPEIF